MFSFFQRLIKDRRYPLTKIVATLFFLEVSNIPVGVGIYHHPQWSSSAFFSPLKTTMFGEEA